jgi:hypothetical protein
MQILRFAQNDRTWWFPHALRVPLPGRQGFLPRVFQPEPRHRPARPSPGPYGSFLGMARENNASATRYLTRSPSASDTMTIASSAESLVLGLCGSSSNSNPPPPIAACRHRGVRSSAGRKRVPDTLHKVPSEWLTPYVLDNRGIIGYNSLVRSDKALRACRVCHARKSSFVFLRSSCLWFLLPIAVKKSRSTSARAGSQMGRWADRCRGIGHPLPTASDGPQAGRWRRAPQRLDSSTYRPQNRGNKARMLMKTKEEVNKSRPPVLRSAAFP